MGNYIQPDKSDNQYRGIGGTNIKIDLEQRNQDLIIEENTIYEIDRECFERLKKQRRKKGQSNQGI